MSAVYVGPGIYPEMPERTYLSDPVPEGSLSHSGAKLILEAPAKYKHDIDGGPKDSGDAMNFGTAVHCAVLEPPDVNQIIAIGEFKDWRSKAAGEFRDEAVADGRAPILAKQWLVAQEMAKRVHDHPVAAAILKHDHTVTERSLFWEADGITKRARVDFMGARQTNGRYIAGDYKTTTDAGIKAFERSIVSYGYHSQAAFYEEGLRTLLGERDVGFFFIAQDKTEPYLVNVVELSTELLTIGHERMQRAVEVYKQCRATGVWPGYSDRVEIAVAPGWASTEHDENRQLWGMAS